MTITKIMIISIGQPSTNPRMLKEYCSLKKAGYRVKVLYAHWADWASAKDEELLSQALDKNDFYLVAGSPNIHKWNYFFSRMFFKVAQLFTFQLHTSFFWKWSLNRPAFSLAKMAKKERADLYIAHNLAALPAAVEASNKWNALCGFDAEDYHLGQSEKISGRSYTIIKRMEDYYMPHCNYITAASPLIGETYATRFNIKDILVVNNVFPIRHLQPKPIPYRRGDTLKLFWFSQTVGADRGLETVIAAMGKLNKIDITFTILGYCSHSERQRLLSLAVACNVKEVQITFKDTVRPDEIFNLAYFYHIGLAIETNKTMNRRIVLTNKIFTYLLAGLAIIATDTPAQRNFMENYKGVGVLYPDGDDLALALVLESIFNDPAKLNGYRLKAWDLARTTLNWEKEQLIFLNRITEVMYRSVGSSKITKSTC